MRIVNVPSAIQQAAQAQAPGTGPNPISRVGAPISLTSELNGSTAVIAGRSAVFDVQTLQPGLRVPYWIDEVRISIGYLTDPGNATSMPAALRFQFNTGNHAVSKRPIPSMLYSQVYGYDEFVQGNRITATTTRLFYNFRWLLPKPLFMPIGDVLQCLVERDATIAASQVLNSVSLNYLGRACAPGEEPPPVRHVPWVAYYKHPYTSTASQTTDEFRNPTLKPLMIQRLIARYTDADGQIVDVNSGLGGLPSSTTRYVAATIKDSMGYDVVAQMTPLGAIIDPSRCAWTYNRALEAREQLSMAFQTFGTTSNYEAYVSMVGSREETF